MNKYHLQELIFKEHYGLLTPGEREVLDILLEHSEEARLMQEAVRREVPPAEAREAMQRFDERRSFDDLMARHTARRAARAAQWVRYSVLLLALLAGGTYWWLQRGGSTRVAVTASDMVVLTLGEGGRIPLNDTGYRQIVYNTTVLNSGNGLLSVAPGSGRVAGGWNTLSVPPGKTFALTLADGSTVWLNSASQLKFPFSFDKNVREVHVEGEAYFRVAPDASRPFTVYGGATRVSVLGTEFNVNAYVPGRIVTSLVHGKVKVQAEGREAELAPGHEAVTRTGESITVRESAMQPGWREGVYYFENQTIAEIIPVLERCFNIKVVADSRAAGKKTFRGKLYREHGLESFLRQMNDTRQVRFFWQNGVLHCQ